jgi:hypothetical protein
MNSRMARSKTTRVARRPVTKNASLLRKLTSNANLPAYIRKLPAPALSRLIDDIGLEDSQEILALVGPEQLKAVLSVALWSNARPGQDEALDLDQFVRWIDIWLQEGEQTLARRVLELGEDFIVMCLSQLLVAVDRTTVGLAESGLEIGQYVLFPKSEKHWHRVVDTVTVLWHHESDFALRVLRRCSFERSILRDDVTERSAGGELYQDIAAERGAARTSVGFVNPMHASLFLMTAKTTDLKELCVTREYDLSTADYLKKQQRIVDRSPAATPDARDQSSGEPGEDEAEGAVTAQNFSALDSILEEAGILQAAPAATPLLTDQSKRPLSEIFDTTLGILASTAPDVASRRMGELAYLSNVLMAGAEIQGKVFTEAEAAKVALATANLGLTYLLYASQKSAADTGLAVEWLEQDPGAVRLFQIGYHLLCTIPSRCSQAVYRAKEIQARRPGHIILMEMDEVLGASRLTDRISEGLYGEAKSVIDGLNAVFEAAACVALRILIDPTPCFPRVLEGGSESENVYVDKGYRHISTMDDFERIAAFLQDLPSYCGN